jgi:HEAT repeat protein
MLIAVRSLSKLLALTPFGARRLPIPFSCANPRIRREAASALVEYGCSAAVKSLVQALKDKKHSVREKVAFALGKIGNSDAVDSLVQALEDERALNGLSILNPSIVEYPKSSV